MTWYINGIIGGVLQGKGQQTDLQRIARAHEAAQTNQLHWPHNTTWRNVNAQTGFGLTHIGTCTGPAFVQRRTTNCEGCGAPRQVSACEYCGRP